ncbi:MAG: hypothetical protein WCP97_08335, partial [bacterium]
MKKSVTISLTAASGLVALSFVAVTLAYSPSRASAAQTMVSPSTCPYANQGAGRGNGNGQCAGGGHQVMLEDNAKAFGISIDELNKALSDGKTMVQIATERGISQDAWKASRAVLQKSRLDALVKAGTITQVDADARLKQFEFSQGSCDGTGTHQNAAG